MASLEFCDRSVAVPLLYPHDLLVNRVAGLLQYPDDVCFPDSGFPWRRPDGIWSALKWPVCMRHGAVEMEILKRAAANPIITGREQGGPGAQVGTTAMAVFEIAQY